MKVGYIRTPKKDQNPDLQRRDLETFGCERFFEEWTSSRKVDQPELRAAMDFWREGDEFVVWKLDRFGRIVYHVFGAMAELERDLILERMMAGLEARARGCKGGRKPVMEERKIALASKLMRDRDTPISKVCDVVGVSRATLYRYLEPDGKLRRRNGTEPCGVRGALGEITGTPKNNRRAFRKRSLAPKLRNTATPSALGSANRAHSPAAVRAFSKNSLWDIPLSFPEDMGYSSLNAVKNTSPPYIWLL